MFASKNVEIFPLSDEEERSALSYIVKVHTKLKRIAKIESSGLNRRVPATLTKDELVKIRELESNLSVDVEVYEKDKLKDKKIRLLQRMNELLEEYESLHEKTSSNLIDFDKLYV